MDPNNGADSVMNMFPRGDELSATTTLNPLLEKSATILFPPPYNCDKNALLKTRTAKLEFEEFYDSRTPVYAILSHTWGEDEVTFQDAQKADAVTLSKAGYAKILETRTIAASYGFDYVWIDTCCIDKSSSAELSEAINSMYECLAESKWFTRGWTLQELIAPFIIVFLDQTWHEIGTKSSLRAELSAITKIPVEVLRRCDPSTASIAQRMAWASRRQTTRIEDQAYCLMGIFDINMPVLYGEGSRAFIRLQQEIMKVSDDHTIFAWTALPTKFEPEEPSLLATSPRDFVHPICSRSMPLPSSSPFVSAITVDSKGIHLGVRLLDHQVHGKVAVLPCTTSHADEPHFVGFRVRVISEPETNGLYAKESELVPIEQEKVGTNSNAFERRICIQTKRKSVKHHPLMDLAMRGEVYMLTKLLEKGAGKDIQDMQLLLE
ncbi:hypothetical protein QBC47DRAFT_409702 [Echria macrotheca]|uniref:Heterokaryon incompatibility domain-containing protein n=1 Tax=Echria macrotheca TaxID=438768 RepID=A0AAJ0BJ25_9PEZI|nr:hypothetical protein QBC47DRAFT_409702 [Echria macrotheca]